MRCFRMQLQTFWIVDRIQKLRNGCKIIWTQVLSRYGVAESYDLFSLRLFCETWVIVLTWKFWSCRKWWVSEARVIGEFDSMSANCFVSLFGLINCSFSHSFNIQFSFSMTKFCFWVNVVWTPNQLYLVFVRLFCSHISKFFLFFSTPWESWSGINDV